MPAKRTPRKEKTLHMEDIGVKGRRTKLTLEDPGIRDEHGLEPIPTFSSPVKPLAQTNGIAQDSTNSAEDSMDIDQSTIPEPAQVRSSQNGRISLPPRATSPRKTNLNTPPRRASTRRSLGAISSPSVDASNSAIDRATSHPPSSRPVNRLLNFSPERPRQSVEYSPPKASAAHTQKSKTGRSGKKGNRVFDLSKSPDENNDSRLQNLNGDVPVNGMDEDEPMPTNNDSQLVMDSTVDQGIPQDYTENQSDALGNDDDETMAPPATSGAQDSRHKNDGSTANSDPDPDDSQMPAPPIRKRPGRPPKKPQVYIDPDTGPVLPPPKSPARGRRKTPISERDPNIQMSPKRRNSRNPSSRNASVSSTIRFVKRSATPANDIGALVTRSGRQSIKPLATWRGEKAVMGDRTKDSLPEIEKVIRVDVIHEQRPQPKRSAPSSRRRRVKPRLADVEEEEEEDEEKAAWEVDPGIQMAMVMDWDPNTNKYDEQNTREEDIAYSYEAIEMRDISGAEFKFAKTLTLDFFGSGMVHLPPGGAKRIKNSRKMQMVFFVFYGRVTVNMGTPPTRFSIGKGGQWQVPRGNFYSITNESNTNDARMFFAQGCEVQADTIDESTLA